MAMDAQPQKPTKLFKYRVSYILKDGNTQEAIITAAAGKTKVFQALDLLDDALVPDAPVSRVVIEIGDERDTA